mmetsp:Transcript_3628/g.11012  ORF Transcript_3628/g.11012 Transcript_3628/m.11012 type:complete len:784 (+) Transcript_3628:63-2414(+)
MASPRVDQAFTFPTLTAADLASGSACQPPSRREGVCPLKIRIVSARGLAAQDGSAVSSPVCHCQVPGKTSSSLLTGAASCAVLPVWEFEAELRDYAFGDPLQFEVRDSRHADVGDDGPGFLGRITLPASAFDCGGFDGEVHLESPTSPSTVSAASAPLYRKASFSGGGFGMGAYLKVSVAGADGTFLPSAVPSESFNVAFDGPPLGLDLDTLDEKFARILKVLDDRKVSAHNESAPPSLKVWQNDYICAANDSFGMDIVTTIKGGGTLVLTVRHEAVETVVLNPGGRSLGMDLTYESEKAVTNDILVRKLTRGGCAAMSGKILQGDRIIEIPGCAEGSTAEQLLDSLQKCKDAGRMEMKLVRPRQPVSGGPVDVSQLLRQSKSDDGLIAQPEQPLYKAALVEVFVRCQPFGGADKTASCHRFDSIPLANGLIRNGISCQFINYSHREHTQFIEVSRNFQALVVRCALGQIKADGGDPAKFEAALRTLRQSGVLVWPSPDLVETMGAKDVLVKVASLSIGLEDTLAYHTQAELSAGMRRTVAFQPRVLKANRGTGGECVWIVKLKGSNYGQALGDRTLGLDEVLLVAEACDGREEEQSVTEFLQACHKALTEKGGGGIVDQRFCPRASEGELRYCMVEDELVSIVQRKPKEGGMSAVCGTGSTFTIHDPQEPLFWRVTAKFLTHDLEQILQAVAVSREQLPLLWSADFINSSPAGTALMDERWVLAEFNCACAGLPQCLAARRRPEAPQACFWDIPPADRSEARRLGEYVGSKVLRSLMTLSTP